MKKCPFCAEEIQDEAIKCKHCGEFLKKEDVIKDQNISEKKMFYIECFKPSDQAYAPSVRKRYGTGITKKILARNKEEALQIAHDIIKNRNEDIKDYEISINEPKPTPPEPSPKKSGTRMGCLIVVGIIFGLLGFSFLGLFSSSNKSTSNSFVWIKVSSANVRSGPSKDNEVIDNVKYNTKLIKTGKNNKWIKVKLIDEKEGWVHESLIAANELTRKAKNNSGIKGKKGISRIRAIVKSTHKQYSLSVFDETESDYFAKDHSKAFEIIVNAPLYYYSSLWKAKIDTYEIMEALYKDPEIGGRIVRVLVTAPPFIRVSLGANDGIPMTTSGNWGGPTNFWKVMAKLGNYEKETGNLKNRTWGVIKK